MTSDERPLHRRPLVLTAAALAVLAYLPALTAAPGRMPSDSKLYLYLDPGRFFGDAASTFDGRQFAGWVPHQHVAYLWPSTPWFWTFETIGVPDWIAHRLWIGSIMLAAGLGVRWCARLLGLGATAAFVAAVSYQLSLYLLPYVSRTSVMLLPWAGLGWIVAFTIRATWRRSWVDPAAIGLMVLTVGAVNATALAMIVPAPVLWLLHAAWSRIVSWTDALLVAVRTAAISFAVSLWWIAMLVIQGRHGTDVLPYSESLADVSLTATAPETWRSLGYWLFYIRDPYAAATTESLRYLTSTISITVSFLIPLLALAALTWCKWAHRRFAALLIGVGLVLAVGVHPIGNSSPLMNLLAGDGDSGLALALRSSTRAIPVTMLGIALALAMAVDASSRSALPRVRVSARTLSAGVVTLLAVANLPSLWTGAFVDPALEREQDPPDAWLDASAALDASGGQGRVLQIPGAEFGAYRWGYTVDQPLPGLTEKPLVTRDLLPLGSPGAMDLLYALDDRIQEGVFEPSSLAPVAQLLGADTVWLTNDSAFDRFRTARPEIVRDLAAAAPGIDDVTAFGQPHVNNPDVAMVDERSIGDARVGGPVSPVELAALIEPGTIVRAAAETVIVSGSGDGLVDAAAAGLLDPTRAAIRYSAEPDAAGEIRTAIGVIVTDSNRDRARHWRSSQDTTGYTEPGGPDQDVLRSVSTDARLPVFDATDPDSQTIAVQRGPARATATAYGEPFAYLPEHRPAMAIDGNLSTAWLVAEHGDPIGEMIKIEFDEAISSFKLHQPAEVGDRRITTISFSAFDPEPVARDTVELTDESWNGAGQTIEIGTSFRSIELTIDNVAGGTPFTGSAVAPVGFSEVETVLGPTEEVVRTPVDALEAVSDETPLAYVLSRLRTDPMNRWRDDPEPALVREIEIPNQREFDVSLTGRIDRRATDAKLAELFGWPVVASTRLTGSPRHAGVSAFDDDPNTAWITAFGEAVGATLSTTTGEPVALVEIDQPSTGYSRITSLTLRSDTDERVVQLVAAPGGTSRGVVDPPLAAGSIEFVIGAIEHATTIDRRFGDPVTLPAAINEIRFDGRPTVDRLGTESIDFECTQVVAVGDQSVSVSGLISGDGWLDGEPIRLEPCEPPIEMAAGKRRVYALPFDLPITIDRIVLDNGVRLAIDAVGAPPTTQMITNDRFERSIRVDGCHAGCWLVMGEGHNNAWTASGPDGDLGEPVQVDGGFNGWWLDPVADPIVIDVKWTAQALLNWALAVSALAALVAVALIVWPIRRGAQRVESSAKSIGTPPTWVLTSPPADVRQLSLLLVVWSALAALLIGPEWVLCGLLGALATWLLRYRRTVELTALASLLAVALTVTVRERRAAPPPNGSWPGTFESLHGIGMFAIVSVLAMAILADDADTPKGPVTTDDAGTS